MIREIAKKEFLQHLKSLRFTSLLLIVCATFILNGLISAGRFEKQRESYNAARSKFRRSTRGTEVYRKPNPLGFAVDGGERFEPKVFRVELGGNIEPLPSEYENFTLPQFEELDWTFIIKVLFSILAIVLTFDAICGEKQRGTLALTCSYSVRRGSILMGKYLGAMLTILLPLGIGMLLSLTTIYLLGTIPLAFGDFARIGALGINTLVYVSAFVFLGLLISGRTHRPPTSLFLCFFLWVIIVLVVPNLAGVLTDLVSGIESEYEFARRKAAATDAYRAMAELREQVKAGRIQTEEELRQKAEEALNRLIERGIKLDNAYRHSIKRRRMLARNFARISPAASFQYAAEELVDTGYGKMQRLYEELRSYQAIYEDYVKSKVGRIVRTSRFKHGWYLPFKGRQVIISPPEAQEYTGDLSDFPMFARKAPSLGESAAHALGDLMLLLTWNVLLFLLAYISLLRYEVT